MERARGARGDGRNAAPFRAVSAPEAGPPATERTVDQLYAGVLDHLAELDALRLRLLGQADAYHTLIAAGQGDLRVATPPPPPPE